MDEILFYIFFGGALDVNGYSEGEVLDFCNEIMGFHDIISRIIAFRDERNWKQFHNPKDLATAISIEAGELQEKFLRKSQEESFDIAKNNVEVADEIADIANYLFLLSETIGIDLEKEILRKIHINEKKYPVEKAKGNATKYDKF